MIIYRGKAAGDDIAFVGLVGGEIYQGKVVTKSHALAVRGPGFLSAEWLLIYLSAALFEYS